MPSSLPPRSIAIVVGTRPELIKMTPIIRRLGNAAWLIHSGQHYDHSLSGQFLDELGLGAPDVVLGVGGRSRAGQLSEAVRLLDELFSERRPSLVVAHGDTNATMAGGLAANALMIPLAHVEAGLRSFDRAMPEEHTRVVVDHLADLLLAPTQSNRQNLLNEGIADERIIVTGNTIVEMVRELVPGPSRRSAILGGLGLESGAFVLSTFHRVENTDDPGALEAILRALGELDLPVIVPMHPRTLTRVRAFGLERLLWPLRIVEPTGYGDFLALLAECALAVSDSGGVQEEVTVLGKPLIVVRRSTERPETMIAHAVLTSARHLRQTLRARMGELEAWRSGLANSPSPFDGDQPATRCVDAITRHGRQGHWIEDTPGANAGDLTLRPASQDRTPEPVREVS